MISNPLFEIWLLMHLEDVSTPLSKKNIYKHMEYHLNIEDNTYIKQKDNNGIIRKIINNESLKSAIYNAKTLESIYNSKNKSFKSNISELNPYTNVHTLIEQFLIVISKM